MTDVAQLQTYYTAFFAAHVAILAIALPVAAAFLLPQAERYSARVLRTLLADGTFLLLLSVILASVAPSAAGLYFSVVPPADHTNVVPGVVLWSFVVGVVCFLALFERTRRLVQPRLLVQRAIEVVSEEDWYGKALARFGSRDYDTPIEAALKAWFAASSTSPAPAASAIDTDSESHELATGAQGANDDESADDDADADKEYARQQARRERLLATHTQREDALAGATGIALRAIEDHDIWTLGAYAAALRDAVLARVGAAKPITSYTAEAVAVALVQLVCHDHLTPLFALAVRSDQRAARILLEAMQEIAVGVLSSHPKVASHVVVRLDGWLDDAVREHASEELVARWLRVLGVIGREAARAGEDSVAVHVVQALAHAGEVLPTVFWTDAPHVFNHPEVEEPEVPYSVVVELAEALAGMRSEYNEQGKLTPAPLVEGTQLIASAFMNRAAIVGRTSYRNERIDRLISQVADDAKRAMEAGNDDFAVLPLARLGMLHDTALACAAADKHAYPADAPYALHVRDPHQLFGIRLDLYYAGAVAESKGLPQAARYAFNGLATPELEEAHIRSLFYEWLPKTLSDHALTADGVEAFTARFSAHFNSNLGLIPFGATDAEATTAHQGDPSPYG